MDAFSVELLELSPNDARGLSLECARRALRCVDDYDREASDLLDAADAYLAGHRDARVLDSTFLRRWSDQERQPQRSALRAAAFALDAVTEDSFFDLVIASCDLASAAAADPALEREWQLEALRIRRSSERGGGHPGRRTRLSSLAEKARGVVGRVGN